MIEIQNLEFQYPRSDFRLAIERLKIEDGERVAIVGPSGSGKTTLLNLVAGIAVPRTGQVSVAGKTVSKMSDVQRRDFRIANVGFVFQRFELIDYLNVRDNILFPFLINRSLQLDNAVKERVQTLADRVGIAKLLGRYPNKLSQGEKQRVAICRALILSPPLILADEPTGNLDPANKNVILDLMLDDANRTFVVVTHDMAVAQRFDRAIDFSDFYASGDTAIGSLAGAASAGKAAK